MERSATLTTCTCALLVAMLSPSLFAHGGQYRGPGDVKPQTRQSQPGTGTTGGLGSTQPGTSSVPVPTTGSSPTTSAGVGAARASRAGYVVGDDQGSWVYWWEFGKDPYLRLRDAIYDQKQVDPSRALWNPRLAATARNIERPSAQDLRAVASQLAATLSATDDRDTASACLIALAKIAPDRAGFDLGVLFRPFLAGGDQELRETAALSFGIAGSTDAETVALLVSLVADDEDGRTASGGAPVNERTRAFAAYACGLLLQRSRDAAASLRLVRTLQAVVTRHERQGRNLLVAAIEALALLPRDWSSKAATTLRAGIVDDLQHYYELSLGAGDQLVQAHVPTAIARLLPTDAPRADRMRERYAADLAAGLRSASAGSATKVNHHVAQSCALALGSMCEPWHDKRGASAAVGALLAQVYREHRDEQTRSFAALALARMGGKQVKQLLLAELPKANKAIEQPWLAVSLGVLAARSRGTATGGSRTEPDLDIVRALLDAFREARNPSTIGAIAIALGLSGSGDAREELRAALAENRKREEMAGYLALSLGLLQDARALPDLRLLRRDSMRRPFVLLQSVRALGLLGDHAVTEELSSELTAPNQSLIRLAATSAALGQIGDRRSIEPLLELLANREVTPLSRAFAAVALGGVCDKDPIPWNAVYASQVNYRAATETLTDGMAGILDLL